MDRVDFGFGKVKQLKEWEAHVRQVQVKAHMDLNSPEYLAAVVSCYVPCSTPLETVRDDFDARIEPIHPMGGTRKCTVQEVANVLASH